MTDAPAPRRAASEHAAQQVEILLRRVVNLIDSARPMPLSSSVMINKDEVLELLDEVMARFPEELRAARWLLRERDEFLEKTRRDADDLIADARTRVAHMVQRTEVVKAAEAKAREIVEAAEEEARRLRHEVEDYCDQKLGSFEIVLERTLKQVAAGREKLTAAPVEQELTDEEAEREELAGAVFDQDEA